MMIGVQQQSTILMQLFEFFINCLIVQAVQAQLAVFLNIGSSTPTLYSNSQANSQFIYADNFLQCGNKLYEYGQSDQQYSQGAPSILSISGNSQTLSISVATLYGHFTPSLNATTCSQSQCQISISYNCPAPLTDINYFDIVSLNLQPIGTFSYFLNCNVEYNTTYFQYGGLILICIATLILIIANKMGRWNAFGGYGIKYEYKMILFVSFSIVTVGLLSLYKPAAASVILDIGNTVSIIVSVSVLAIEALYFTKIKRIQKVIFQKGSFSIRILDILGVLTSIPVIFLWWVLQNNWIFSDILSILLVITIIKVFKFVSFKIALVAYFFMIVIYASADIVLSLRFQNQYRQYFLYQATTPYQLQFPLLTPAFGEKCELISITTVAFPGLLVSYLRRFDHSRSTRIYLVTAISTYFLGSVIWWVSSTFSYYPLPFDAFCQPIMIIAFTLFAFKRKELRTLWEGKFFDEQFKNKAEIQAMGQAIGEETTNPQDFFKQQLGEKLFFEMNEDSQYGDAQKQLNNDQL